MMLAGGASSGAVAGGGVHVGVDVERQVDVGAVGDCAGAGSGDAPDAVDALATLPLTAVRMWTHSQPGTYEE